MYKLITVILFTALASNALADSALITKYKKSYKSDKEFSKALKSLSKDVQKQLAAIPKGDDKQRAKLEYLVGLETDLEIVPTVKCSEVDSIVLKMKYHYAPKSSKLHDIPRHSKDFLSLILAACSRN